MFTKIISLLTIAFKIATNIIEWVKNVKTKKEMDDIRRDSSDCWTDDFGVRKEQDNNSSPSANK